MINGKVKRRTQNVTAIFQISDCVQICNGHLKQFAFLEKWMWFMQFVIPFFVTSFAPSNVYASQTRVMMKNARKCLVTMITDETLRGLIWKFRKQNLILRIVSKVMILLNWPIHLTIWMKFHFHIYNCQISINNK